MKTNPLRGPLALIFSTALLALALCPALAAASSVAKGGSTLTYNAAAAESNSLVVSLSAGIYTFDDSGATVTVGAGCTVVNVHRATCAASGVGALSVNAGDLNDLAWVTTATPATITGSDGNDLLIGNNAADLLIGCTGNDTLTGGGGADTLVDGFFNCAGGGNDSFDGGPGPDAMFGGPGTDTVSYSGRSASVFVSIDGAANDGEAGEGDSVSDDVENVTGGSAGDDISGGPGANTLNGGGGDDVILGEKKPNPTGPGGDDSILGGAGNDALNGGDGDNLILGNDGSDMLQGGSGADSIDGGTGDDEMHALDGVVDSVNCGTGADSGEADVEDVVSPSCESVDRLSFDSIDTGDFTDFGSDFPSDCGTGASGGSGDGFGGFDGLSAEGISDCAAFDLGCSLLRISRRKTGIRRGEVAIRLSLPDVGDGEQGVVCRGKLKLSLADSARKASSRRVRIGSAPFSLRSGKSKKVEVGITRTGMRLFGQVDRLQIRAAAFVRQGGEATKVASAPIVVHG